MKQLSLQYEPLAVVGDVHAWCAAYAFDVHKGLVYAHFVSRTKKDGESVRDWLMTAESGGVTLENKVILKRQTDIVIPWNGDVGVIDPKARKRGSVRYRAAYTPHGPDAIRTEVGYETIVVHRDATMTGIQANHNAYVLRWPSDSDEVFEARFLRLWSQATCLPRKEEGCWFSALWKLGQSLLLIEPLETHGCRGWRLDPRGTLPGGKSGWESVLELAVTMGDEIGGQ